MVEPGSTVGVVGAGTMGAGIAEVAARAGHDVLLLDADPAATDRALTAVGSRLDRDVERHRLTAEDAAAVRHRLHPTRSLADLAACTVVVEAVAEDLAAKRQLLHDLDALLKPDALVATNTSSLSITAIAAGSADPSRVVGLHFFNPAQRMRLVEVVRGDATSDATADAARTLAEAWGKTPVTCTSTPGFVVNRVARPYYGEAQRLVEERIADAATVDAVLRGAGGFPMGPFELTDLVGQDVNLAVSRSVWEQTFHDPRYAPTVLQQRLVDAGRLGRKTGRGVFTYADDGRTALDAAPSTEPPRPAPAAADLRAPTSFAHMQPFLDRIRAGGARLRERSLLMLADLRDDADDLGPTIPGIDLPAGAKLMLTGGATADGTYGGDGGTVLLDWAFDPATCTRVALMPSTDCVEEALHAAVGLCQAAGVAVSVIRDSPGGIVARTVSMLVNEAVDLVARGEASADDVDTAMVLGAGYPIGPLAWGDRLGPEEVAPVVAALHEAYPTGRYRVSPAFDRAVLTERSLRDA